MPKRKFQSIPSPVHIEVEVQRILVPMVDAVERAILKPSGERMVSIDDLLTAGVITQVQADAILENR